VNNQFDDEIDPNYKHQHVRLILANKNKNENVNQQNINRNSFSNNIQAPDLLGHPNDNSSKNKNENTSDKSNFFIDFIK